MRNMAEEFAGRASILAVNTDGPKAVAKVAPFLNASGYDDIIVPLDTAAKVQELLQVQGSIPFLILFVTHPVCSHINQVLNVLLS